jgi:tRNA-2-methylthio-N6-dimethylallyladenosine synthase
VEEVLVEGPSRSGRQLCGRTRQNRIVNFEAPPETLGAVLPVRIVSARAHSLEGSLRPAATAPVAGTMSSLEA